MLIKYVQTLQRRGTRPCARTDSVQVRAGMLDKPCTTVYWLELHIGCTKGNRFFFFPKSAVLFWLPSFSIYQLCKWTVTRISTIRGNFFGVTRSLRRDRQRGSRALSLLVPQLSASKLFISQSIIFSLFWTPVLEMKRQTARAVFLHLRSGKHDLLGLHSPPKHTPTVPTCCLKTHSHAAHRRPGVEHLYTRLCVDRLNHTQTAV